MLRPKATCVEEMGRNIVSREGTKILDVFVGLKGRRYLANVESKLAFHDFEAGNSQVMVSLVYVDEIFMLSLGITQEVEEGCMKGEYRLVDIVRIHEQ
jgi:hypothetical protein